jgi:Polysaccharide lyase
MKIFHIIVLLISGLVIISCNSKLRTSSVDNDGSISNPPEVEKKPPNIPKNNLKTSNKTRIKPRLAYQKNHQLFSFHGGFESNNLTGFDFSWLKVKKAISIVNKPVRKGSGALLVTLARNQAMYSKGKRSELAVPYTFEIGKSYWFGISIYIPLNWKEDFKGEVLTQWFATRDKHLGEKGRSPSLAIRIKKNKWHITNRWDQKPLTIKNSGNKKTLYSTPFKGGIWTDWAIFVKWSWKKDGIVRIYLNKKLVAEKSGPNTYNDQKGPIMKFGIYKAPWNKPSTPSAVKHRMVYFDEIHIKMGNSNLNSVSP